MKGGNQDREASAQVPQYPQETMGVRPGCGKDLGARAFCERTSHFLLHIALVTLSMYSMTLQVGVAELSSCVDHIVQETPSGHLFHFPGFMSPSRRRFWSAPPRSSAPISWVPAFCSTCDLPSPILGHWHRSSRSLPLADVGRGSPRAGALTVVELLYITQDHT